MSEANSVGSSANQKKAAQVQSGAARAATLGISDGLVTNTALILGVAGASSSVHIVIVAGVASLVAGAFSMAVGEYISMKAQSELLAGVLRVEEQAIKNDPENAQKALTDIMKDQGLSQQHAASASQDLVKDSQKAMAVYAKGRLGIDPNELGSPYAAGGSSLITFALGAFVPLIPWLFLTHNRALYVSLILSGLAAIGVGGYLGRQSGVPWYRVAARQLLLIAAATAITFFIGRLFHATI
ncbi:MAG: VIT1/CCC1 transporter family protein [Candidatus Saccharimonadales bacterium]